MSPSMLHLRVIGQEFYHVNLYSRFPLDLVDVVFEHAKSRRACVTLAFAETISTKFLYAMQTEYNGLANIIVLLIVLHSF